MGGRKTGVFIRFYSSLRASGEEGWGYLSESERE